MKAKVGNRVVNVIPDDGRYLDISDMTYYDAADLSFDFDDDWQAFRREAAKDILAGLVVQKNWRYHPDEYDKYEEEAQKRAAKRAAYTAIVYADELIKQLKED